MTTVEIQPAATRVPNRSGVRWPRWALAATCALSAALYCWGIGGSWANSYYSAAVKSMSQSFETFFFGSFDAAGVVTVDKPPMALWLQVLSVQVFGFNQFAVLFPQALAGVAAVFLLHRTVRRWAGEHAALLAALVLALTPITVVINRDNNPDTLLVLLVVAAAYAMTRTFGSRNATGWLALAAFLVGCGFLTKMLQAWMVLPAFIAAYLIGSRAGWGRRVLDLGVAAAVLLVSSFWWVVATTLWPSPKPYIGGSEDGSAWDLVFGYNGFGRIFGGDGNMGGGSGGPSGGGGGFSGQSGILRLFNEQLAGQISWLLPLCALVLIAMLVVGVRHWRGGGPLERERAAGWVLWGGWLVVIGLMFSFAQGTMHPYYTTMLAPAVGAVVGAGVVRFWRWYREPQGKAWLLLPVGLAITVAWAMVVVARDLSWHAWAGYAAVGAGALAVVVLVVGRRGRAGLAKTGLVLSLVAALMVPTAWSAIGAVSGQSGMGGANPTAGPATGMGGPGGRGPGGMRPPGMGGDGMRPPGTGDGSNEPGAGQVMIFGGMGDESLSDEQRKLLDYVQANAGGLQVPLAVEGGAHGAAAYIINSDLTVVGMGGFTGSDDAPSVAQLTEWKQSGQLGFVLLGGGMGGGARERDGMRLPNGVESPGGMQPPEGMRGAGGPGGQLSSEREEWVKQNCTPVDPAAWGGSADTSQELYACQ
ncbi:glycosyltransferase family 39 protein [Saccharopolyspora sp. K220]|uniref:ArnT family glycosyltransferase n=1 Tax=Saccharopolyspora soli TaxID=2926618 RepID=UPI001F594DDA|nr:glycosyltransferase family 39 protein [Saccharopolyspora soli]MCI2422840.1 glycosyltransferase family 39 protein [Saccharopolyspora soli]